MTFRHWLRFAFDKGVAHGNDGFGTLMITAHRIPEDAPPRENSAYLRDSLAGLRRRVRFTERSRRENSVLNRITLHEPETLLAPLP